MIYVKKIYGGRKEELIQPYLGPKISLTRLAQMYGTHTKRPLG